MDSVNNHDDSVFYIEKHIADDVRAAGRAAVKSFGVKSRFVHFEFFRLTEDHDYLGKKGKIIGLEVNYRPSGGFTPDMINYACSTDVYKDWADMVAFDRLTKEEYPDKYYCVSAGCRKEKHYLHSYEEVMAAYKDYIMMTTELPEVLASAMGDRLYLARFAEKEAMDAFISDVFATA